MSSFDDASMSSMRWQLKRRSPHENGKNYDIGELMQQLVRAEYGPVEIVIEGEGITLVDLLLRPIDVIVHEKLGREDRSRKAAERLQSEHGRKRPSRMKSGVKESAGVTVNALVAVLVGRLQNEIAEEVLHFEQNGAPKKQSES